MKQLTEPRQVTTVTGSITLTAFLAGAQADKAASSTLESTISNATKVLNSPETSLKEKEMASRKTLQMIGMLMLFAG